MVCSCQSTGRVVAGRQQKTIQKKHCNREREIMRKQQAKAVRKSSQRTPSAKTIDVRSPLARKMLKLVVQFDQAYDQLKEQWIESGAFPEQVGMEFRKSAQQAVQEFSIFVKQIREQAGLPGNGDSV